MSKKLLEDEVVCVSGKFENHTQEEMESLVTENGGTISSSVTKKTTLLVTGDKVGATKLNKATELGIRIMKQTEFFQLICPSPMTESITNDDKGKAIESIESEEIQSEGGNHHYTITISCRGMEVVGYALKKNWLEDLKKADFDFDALFSDYYDDGDEDMHEHFIGDDRFSMCVLDENDNTVYETEDWESIRKEDSGQKTTVLDTTKEYFLRYMTMKGYGCSYELETDGPFDSGKMYFRYMPTELKYDGFRVDDLFYEGGTLKWEGSDNGAEQYWDNDLAKYDKKTSQWNMQSCCDFEEKMESTGSDAFEGEVVCVSGKFGQYSQKDAESLLEKNGATISSSVTKKTTLLVIGEKPGDTKMNKAKELGVRIMEEEEFYQKLKMVKPCRIESYEYHNNQELVDFEIPMGVVSIEECAFLNCSGLTSVFIPSTVTKIGSCAFSGCTGLKNVVIPASVIEIDDRAFEGCCVDFKVEESNPSYVSVDGNLLTKDKSCLIRGNALSPISSFVTEIGQYAFCGCTSLTSVEIPDGVTKIGRGAFWECTGLTNVVIPSSVTRIENEAFRHCTGLTCVEIPSSVTEIGRYVFMECTGLTNVVVPDIVIEEGNCAFSGCAELTSVEIPPSVKKIGCFCGCSGLTSVSIPTSVTEIGPSAFWGCSGLKSVEIPTSVTKIGDAAFASCTGLMDIEIPDSVTSIGNSVFWGCTGLKSVSIPSSVTSIGSQAFLGCTGLKSVSIPSSVTQIGEHAFCDCSGLTSVTIPDGVTRIENVAFLRCTSLTSVEIPSSVTKIGWGAFDLCQSLVEIIVPKEMKDEVLSFVNKNIVVVKE